MARHKAKSHGNLFGRDKKSQRDSKEVQTSERPEKPEELDMQPSQLADIFTPDRSGTDNIRDRGR